MITPLGGWCFRDQFQPCFKNGIHEAFQFGVQTNRQNSSKTRTKQTVVLNVFNCTVWTMMVLFDEHFIGRCYESFLTGLLNIWPLWCVVYVVISWQILKWATVHLILSIQYLLDKPILNLTRSTLPSTFICWTFWTETEIYLQMLSDMQHRRKELLHWNPEDFETIKYTLLS